MCICIYKRTTYSKEKANDGSVAQPGRALNQIDIWRGAWFKSEQSHHQART